MSYWANHPELYDEIIFKQMIKEGLAKEEDFERLDDVVREFVKKEDSYKVCLRAEQEYWESLIDAAKARRER